MEPHRDERDADRKMMEEVPQEPIAADPIEDDDTDDAVDEVNPGAPVSSPSAAKALALRSSYVRPPRGRAAETSL